jgi:hypothetical protein
MSVLPLQELPRELLVQIILLLDIPDYASVFCLSRAFHSLCDELFFKQIYQQNGGQLTLAKSVPWRTTWREIFLHSSTFSFVIHLHMQSSRYLANMLKGLWYFENNPLVEGLYIERGLTVHRKNRSTPNNPAVRTVKPFSLRRVVFEAKIVKMGNWLSIGVAQSRFPLHNHEVLGSHHDCFNIGYYVDRKSHHLKLRAWRVHADCKEFAQEDVIRIQVDFEQLEIRFFANDMPQGPPVKFEHEEASDLYPTIALGANCIVQILT